MFKAIIAVKLSRFLSEPWKVWHLISSDPCQRQPECLTFTIEVTEKVDPHLLHWCEQCGGRRGGMQWW